MTTYAMRCSGPCFALHTEWMRSAMKSMKLSAACPFYPICHPCIRETLHDGIFICPLYAAYSSCWTMLLNCTPAFVSRILLRRGSLLRRTERELKPDKLQEQAAAQERIRKVCSLISLSRQSNRCMPYSPMTKRMRTG